MICPHCKQGTLHIVTAHFSSNLNPAGSQLTGQDGWSCKICGHWIDVINIKKSIPPKETYPQHISLALHRKEEGARTKALINKYFEYILFLRKAGYSWDAVAIRFNLSRTAVYKRYYELEEERKNK